MKNPTKLLFLGGFVIGLLAVLIVPMSDLLLRDATRDSTGTVSLALLPQPVITVRTGCIGRNPRATISWRQVKGASTYTLYRNSLDRSWSPIAEDLVVTSYADTSFPAGAGNYQYQLKASDAAGRMNHSHIINTTVPSCVSSATSTPSALSLGSTTPNTNQTATNEFASATTAFPSLSTTPSVQTAAPIQTVAPSATDTALTGTPASQSGQTAVTPPPTNAPASTTVPPSTSVPVTASPPVPTPTQTATPSATASATALPSDPANLIQNPSFETVGTNGDPANWFRGGWGTNNRVLTYPVPGIDGTKAAKVQITSLQNGDVKWYFKEVAVTPGSTYTLSHAYKATVPTEIGAHLRTPAGLTYHYLATLGAVSNWTDSAVTITVPAQVTHMTVFHLLFSAGTLEVDRYRLVKNASAPTPTVAPVLSTPPTSTTGSTATTPTTATTTPASNSNPQPAPTPAPLPIPVPAPTPIPSPTPVATPVSIQSKYVMLNAITWGSNPLQNLPLQDVSEATYFVLTVDPAGNLLETNSVLETKFVADVKARGKKATFSVAGGSQNISHVTSAVTTNKDAFINNIAAHMTQFGYDGVVLDIENTSLPASALPTFINQLRGKLGSGPSIGVYVQHWQIDTVHAELQKASSAITWLSPMIYDFGYTLDELKSLTLAWLPKVGGNKAKLLAGVAVNYASGVTVEQYREVLRWVSEQGLGGVGVWENTLFTQPWIDVQRTMWPTLK